MKTHLIIFGTDDYQNAISSLINSSKDYFTDIHVFSTKDIDSNFYNEHIEILNQRRGAGYWLWKPYFINKVLTNVNYGDIIFYVDAGNIFLYDPSFLYEKINENNGVILFDNRDGVQNGESSKNFISCKKDCFVLMNCDSIEYINGNHLNASYQIYSKNDFTLKFVKDYLESCKNKYILTDTPNQHGQNYDGYYDHRHDQSVLSLISIKNNINPLVDPSEWGNKCGCRGFDQLFLHHRNPNYKL
jgi:hypothetical protein